MNMSIGAANDWKIFGEVDPYFGVLANDRFRAGKIDDAALEDFFASGIAHVDKVMDVMTRTFGVAPHGTALDFGCGVGRIANALAPRFESVVGLDIAPGMLERAEHDAARRGVRNVTYASSLYRDRLQPETYDFVHSYIVLQHIPTSVGEGIIRDIVRATKTGGFGALHFTYGHATRPFLSTLKNVVKKTPVLREIGNLFVGRSPTTPAMQMNNYSIARVIAILADCGVERFGAVRVDDWGHLGLFVLFQKGADSGGFSNPKPR